MARVQPIFPNLVDPSGVNCSNVPRDIGITTDETRAYAVKNTEGQPEVQFGGTSNPYVDYQFIDLLHTLQAPRSQGYDETCFYLMGQVKELLFNALHFELYNARHQIDHDEIVEAIRMISRARVITTYIGKSWDVLSTITVDGFNEFRNSLGQASGQLSFMYRHVEFILGNKSARLARAHSNIPHVWPKMKEALESPSLYDRIIALLARRGHAIDAQALQRDWSQPYAPNESVEKAWLHIYQAAKTDNVLYELGEALITLDDHISQYRWRHFTSVSRIIGHKPGTGGSAGVGWLRHVTEHRFFPELWSLRTSL
ncbi:MAG: tryptophan 2,3-dioxygenase [Brachymonas sp.]|nr:tryptophan 2,3-dioxygenase [Brachymonas sp.]